MEIIAHQGFGECVCKIVSVVYITHQQNIVGNTLPDKMVAKRQGFLVQGATGICWVQHHNNVVNKYSCGFGYIDPH